jgi:L-ascorbate metabolism protein UlaG (beta-lactamase superfamily)
MNMQTLGKNPSGGKEFKNIGPTEVMAADMSYITLIRENMHKPTLVTPSRPLPTIKTDLQALADEKPAVVWFGHSSYLINYNGLNILVDPVLFGTAAPVSFSIKPFPGTTLYKPEDFPSIDLLIITHDHYDHLSYETVLKLKNKIKKIIAPIGVGSHLQYWGFDTALITELDWHMSNSPCDGVDITALPARHFSGRFLKRNRTLWTSYVLKLHEYKIFIGGDSGYDKQFKITGDTYGPFDLAFVECGQYGKNWPHIHMFPEQAAQAALDLKTKILMPVHWSKFSLSVHIWNEPIKRLLAAAASHAYDIVLPMIGEKYILGSEVKNKEWWNFE